MDSCDKMLFYIVLFITHCVIMANFPKEWLGQYSRYDNEFHVLLNYEDLHLSDFTSQTTGNFTTLVFYNGSLLVGARNSVFIMNTTTAIENVTEISWIPLKSQRRNLCIQSGTPPDECFNYIKVLAVHSKKIFCCGTNSHYPICSWREMNTLQKIEGSAVFYSKEFVNANPHITASYSFSDDGRFFSSVTMGAQQNDIRITNTEFRNFLPNKMLFTKPNDLSWLDDSIFYRSFTIGVYIYFFFDEFCYDCSGCDPVRYSRVARICQNDYGGNNFMNWNNFVTFQKARLNCSSGGKYRYHFNNMRDVYWDEQKQTFYGVFTMKNSHDEKLSALCSYSLTQIEKVFSGEVKYQNGGFWKKMNYPGHIKKCKFTSKSSSNSHVSSEKLRMSTRQMSREALYDQNKCILASDAVQPITGTSLFYLSGIEFLKVIVLSINLPVEAVEIWYIATDRGTILKSGKIPSAEQFCIFEEYNIFSNEKKKSLHKIKEMVLAPGKAYIIIGSDFKLIRLPLQICGRYINESYCLGAQDPLCGWDVARNKCVAWNETNENSWRQSFTSCQNRWQRPAQWSSWSAWSVLKNNDGNFCKYRNRKCIYSRKSFVCDGVDYELANCSVDASTLTSQEQWWFQGPIHGSWSGWSNWTECLRGYQNRTRTCSNPSPANGGYPCTGSDIEFFGCEPAVCDDPTNVKINQSTFTYWSTWFSCNDTTEKIRIRHSCTQNVTNKEWICNGNDVDYKTKDSVASSTCNHSMLGATMTKKLSTAISTVATILSTNQISFNPMPSSASSTESLSTIRSSAVRTISYQGEPSHFTGRNDEWSACECNHNVMLLNRSLGIQHREFVNKDRSSSECRTCPCQGRRLTTPPILEVSFPRSNDEKIGKYSLKIVIIIVSICCLMCVLTTVMIAIVWNRKRTKSIKLKHNDERKIGKRSDKYIPVNQNKTTCV
ncbi:semaphorin-5B-like [Xenia sp. Carnegie-2017]|uniref:semaphorin-5B-like n=1 Tax=Xenia sp. Carnegie-2017 TaxID=2897299 RepID=UPI001F043B0D|nr:semaphorin-5B-like [Xenia sp. Carnegie-2017]XP_046846482.1 semaphorin-5B-like [Xenia sp. Carnegie-2017]